MRNAPNSLPRANAGPIPAPGLPPQELPRRARKLHVQGGEDAKANRWKPALQAFREAARLAPWQPGFNYCAGVALCRFDRFEEAIVAFRTELRNVPDHAPALAEIGTCYARTGRPRDGIPYLQNGLRLGAALCAATESRRAGASSVHSCMRGSTT